MSANASTVLPLVANREAEHSILGALLLDNRLFDVIGDMVLGKHFVNEFDGEIFSAIAAQIIACRPCDVITLSEAMKGRVDVAYLHGLTVNAVVSQSLARRHAEIVVERFKTRELLSIVDSAQEIAHDSAVPIEERVEAVTSQLSELLNDLPGDEWASSQDCVIEAIDRANDIMTNPEAAPAYIPTGISTLDERLNGGLRAGNMIVLAARPSMGKTALAMTIAEHVALDQGLIVGFFSLEMDKSDLTNRRLSSKSGVNLNKIIRPERMSQPEWQDYTEAIELLRHSAMYVYDKAALNLQKLRIKARALKRKGKLGLLVIDYFGLMETDDSGASANNRTAGLGAISRGIKRLAKEIGVPVIVLAQLNREVEKRPDPMPILSDLRECGDLEQDADLVLFIHRAIQANKSLPSAWKEYGRLGIAKQRGGETGEIDIRYIGHNTKFADWIGEKPSKFGSQKSTELL